MPKALAQLAHHPEGVAQLRVLGQGLQGRIAAHRRLRLPIVLSELAPRIGGGIALRYTQAEEIEAAQHQLTLSLALLGGLAQPECRLDVVGFDPKTAVIHESDAGLGPCIVAVGERPPQPHGRGKVAAVEGRQAGPEILLGRAGKCDRNRQRGPDNRNGETARKMLHGPVSLWSIKGGSTSPSCRRCRPRRDRHRCSVWTCKDRPRPRKGRKQRRGAVLAGDADGGRQPVRGRRPRPDHSYVDKAVGACAGVRVEDVMETPGRLEGGAIAARHRKRHVFKLDRAGDAARRHAVADADPPRMTLRMATDGAKLAEIDHGTFEAFIAQQIRDGVGDKSLREAVEGDTNAGTRKGDMRVADVDIAEIDELSCDIAGAGLDVLLDVAVRPEMRLIEPPQWLHRDIEGAVAQYAEATAFLHKGAQFARRLMQCPSPIETRDFAVLAVEAENALITRDLAADPQDGSLRQRGIGVP